MAEIIEFPLDTSKRLRLSVRELDRILDGCQHEHQATIITGPYRYQRCCGCKNIVGFVERVEQP
jgi:hypothetical protein